LPINSILLIAFFFQMLTSMYTRH